MKRLRALGLVILTSFFALSLRAQENKNFRISFEPEASYTSGETQYDMYWIVDPVGADLIGIRSLLEFPLNSFYVGGTLRLRQPNSVRYPLGVALSVTTKVNDPSGKMKDGDWLLFGTGEAFKGGNNVGLQIALL